jgi:hypothetical protein
VNDQVKVAEMGRPCSVDVEKTNYYRKLVGNI